MKGKIVIIGANDFQNQLILKAKSLGYETHVFAWKDGSIGERTADYFYPISIVEKEEILEKCKEIKPVGVCSIASDLATITVNYVAENLGLPCNPTANTLSCTNKYEMRKKMKEHQIKTPHFIKVSEDSSTWNLDGMSFPMIVKPTDRSGSRGITKIFKKEELEDAVHYSCKDSFEKMSIVEEYIEGNEYSCECISYKGKHHFLAFTKKYTTGSPNFIETGHCEPSDIRAELQEEIKNNIFAALTALNIQNGASHTEFKVDENGNFGIIEIGARMGGDCIGSDLVQISTGYDFVKMNPTAIPSSVENGTVIKIYYQERESSVSNSGIEKIGTQVIKTSKDRVNYKLTYKTQIDNYIGTGKVKIVDTLPYPIDEAQSILKGGIYSAGDNTITWEEDLGAINTYNEAGYNRTHKVEIIKDRRWYLEAVSSVNRN